MPFTQANGNVSKIAYDKSVEALDKSTNAKQIADSTKAEFDQVVIEGDSSVEAAQARVDSSGNPHTTLKERLDTEYTEIHQKVENNHNDVTAQLAQKAKQIVETNYVDMLKKMSYYTDITFVKTHDGGMQQFDVHLKNAKTQLKMTFAKPDDYFKLSGIRVSTTSKTTSEQKSTVNDVNFVGDWYLPTNDSHPRQAESAGAYVEYTFTVTDESSDVTITHFADNRGGIFEATLNGANPVTYSTYSDTAKQITRKLYTDLPTGEYTLKMEFKGDDPQNAPSGGAGTSRGWANSVTTSGVTVYYITINSESTVENGEVVLMADTSNKEFAFSISPIGSENFQWIPQHATATAFNRNNPIFLLDGVEYSFSDFAINQQVNCKDFKLIQDIYGRNPDSGNTNLVNIKTIHSVTLDGNINVSGSMEVLQDIQINSSYVIMSPVNNAIFDVLQTGWGNQYPTTKTDGSSTTLSENADCGNYIFLSSANDYFVAFRHTDKRGNFDLNGDSIKKPHNFVNHRDVTLLKHYINIFDKQTLPKGYKTRWSGDYITGSLKGVYGLMID